MSLIQHLVHSRIQLELNHDGLGYFKEMQLQEQPSRTLNRHSDWIRQIKFLADGCLATSSDDQAIKVWNTTSGEELFTLKGHVGPIYSIAVLPNHWLASGSGDKSVKVWDLEERVEVRTLEGHTGSIYSLGVLKNGNLVSCSKDDSSKTWNPYLTTNNLLMTIS